MELDRIEQLIEKYFEADTTVAEEKQLKEYFEKEEVAPHLKQYAPMFTYFSQAKDERFTKQVPLKPRVTYYKWISIAAVAVMVFGIYFGKEYQEQQEAQYAYNQTRMALGMLAENFDRGTEKMVYLKEFEQAKQKIYKNN